MVQLKTPKKASIWLAIIPLVILIGLLSYNVYLYGSDATSGANQIALLLAAVAAAIIGLSLGHKWENIFEGALTSIISALPSLMILLLIGSLAGTWMISGIVPGMIYYGLKLLNPTIFLFAACFICCLVSLATGSSWSTVATIGIALIGIGKALGFSGGLVAGAIISGSYFGDKMSPMSDTTNLAPAMAGTDIFTHIKMMMWTTMPAIGIALVIYLVMGFSGAHKAISSNEMQQLLSAIQGKFYVTPLIFVVPGIVIILIIKKMPPVPALFIGTMLGAIFAIIFQPQIINEISGISGNYFKSAYKTVVDAIAVSVSIKTTNESINNLLSTGGMAGMLSTIWLIICAMVFGGMMEAVGLLETITKSVIKFAHSTTALVATTAGSCIFVNGTASDQYLAIVVPGRMFKNIYRERNLQPELLSRTLEDAGTVTSVLFPWNTGGATQSRVLGVATGDYWLYCFFNLISPVMSVIAARLGWGIKKRQKL